MTDEWVRVSVAVGSYVMPATAAEILKQAIEKMIARGEINHRWQALELLAADYLAGP